MSADAAMHTLAATEPADCAKREAFDLTGLSLEVRHPRCLAEEAGDGFSTTRARGSRRKGLGACPSARLRLENLERHAVYP